jgi:hypothetical protein
MLMLQILNICYFKYVLKRIWCSDSSIFDYFISMDFPYDIISFLFKDTINISGNIASMV